MIYPVYFSRNYVLYPIVLFFSVHNLFKFNQLAIWRLVIYKESNVLLVVLVLARDINIID